MRLRVFPLHGQLHGGELLLSRQLQVKAIALARSGSALFGDGIRHDNSCDSHLWEEDDHPRHGRVLKGLIDGGSDGRGGHADVCRPCALRDGAQP